MGPRLLASAVLANGSATLLAFPGARSLWRRTVVYYPGVDTDRFSPAGSQARRSAKESLGLPSNAPVVVSIGSISPIKGTDLFLDIAEIVSDHVRDSRFVFVGAATARNRSFEAKIRASIRDRDLEAVMLLGHRDDVEGIVAAADVVLITSRSEGTTTTVGEAMSAGCRWSRPMSAPSGGAPGWTGRLPGGARTTGPPRPTRRGPTVG